MKLLSFVTQSIGRKIISAFTATLVLMMALAWISYSSIGELRSTSHWVSHTHEVLGQLERVSSELKDAETGQRGYLITGEDRYLEPYNSARTSAEEAVANLRDLTSDNPAQQKRIDDLTPLIDAKFAELQETIDLRRTEGFEASREVVRSDRGKATMDDIRTILDEMVAEEQALLESRDAKSADMAGWVFSLIALLSVLALVVSVVVGVILTRSISGPVGKLSEAATRMKNGHYDATVEVDTNDEISTLATSFNQMVGRIKDAIQEAEAQEKQAQKAQDEAEEAQRRAETRREELQSSVETMLEAMGRFADGDLTVRVDESGVEGNMARLFEGFNRSVGNLRQMVGQVREAAESTSASASQISSSSDQMAASTEEQSAQAEEVAEMIGQVQSESEEAVERVRQGTERVDEGLGLAGQAGEALDAIVGSIEERADEIAAASEEQSTTSEKIAQSIQSISTAAQESAAGVTQVAGAAEDLESVTDRLGANVEQFDLGEGAGGEKSHVGRGDSEGQGDPEAPPQASPRASRDYGGDGHPSSKASL